MSDCLPHLLMGAVIVARWIHVYVNWEKCEDENLRTMVMTCFGATLILLLIAAVG